MSADLPIPSRMSNFIAITEDRGDIAVKGLLKCSCGRKNFSVYYFGKKGLNIPLLSSAKKTKYGGGRRIVLIAKCNDCKAQLLIYDSFTDNRENHKKSESKITGNYHNFNCSRCSQSNLNLSVAYNSCGKDKLAWQNMFSWKECFEEIFISGVCVGCNKIYDALLEE